MKFTGCRHCRLRGVLSVAVSLMEERAVVEYESNVLGLGDIKEAIEDCGFEAELEVQVGW